MTGLNDSGYMAELKTSRPMETGRQTLSITVSINWVVLQKKIVVEGRTNPDRLLVMYIG